MNNTKPDAAIQFKLAGLIMLGNTALACAIGYSIASALGLSTAGHAVTCATAVVLSVGTGIGMIRHENHIRARERREHERFTENFYG